MWDNRPGHKLRCPELPRRLLNGLGAAASGARGDEGVRHAGHASSDKHTKHTTSTSSARQHQPHAHHQATSDAGHSAGSTPHATTLALAGIDDWAGTRLPVIGYLLDKYHASANSRNGYFLARAVLARHLPFVELLLRHDADPSLNDGYAVNVAIGTGDIALVKMLMERNQDARPTEELEVAEAEVEDGRRKKKKKRRRESDGGGGGKRRKVQDRCQATSKMLEVAMKEENWEMVTYLQSKGEYSRLARRGLDGGWCCTSH